MHKINTPHTSYSNSKTLKLVIDNYPGGVAIWGALPAVFDTSQQGFDRGVHVHARKAEHVPKSIDATFSKVEVEWQGQIFEIDECAAVHFTMASIFDIDIQSLSCNYCNSNIISTGINAIIPSHVHICQVCKKINKTEEVCIINPIIDLKKKIGDPLIKRESYLPNRKIVLDNSRFFGGIQIWGSNPSIIWTAKRLEESAIHVHAYNSNHKRVVDNTYSQVLINNEYLDIEMIRVLQIQMALPGLSRNITTVHCPYCHTAQFDKGRNAVLAQAERTCEECERCFEHPKAISNPALNLLKSFREMEVSA